MRIVYPYQVVSSVPRAPRRAFRGLGALCDYTPGCACKGEIVPFFEDINRIRNEIAALMGSYGAYVPQWLKDKLARQEANYLPIYEAFKRADERCYGNWKLKISQAPADYEQILREINEQLTQQAEKINAGGSGTSTALPNIFSPSAPLIPGTSAELNPWIIAGAVGLALFIGYRLMRKV